jgi:hypothetical protein
MIDHTGHPHPSTPKARALCRANGGTGFIGKLGAAAPVAKKSDNGKIPNVPHHPVNVKPPEPKKSSTRTSKKEAVGKTAATPKPTPVHSTTATHKSTAANSPLVHRNDFPVPVAAPTTKPSSTSIPRVSVPTANTAKVMDALIPPDPGKSDASRINNALRTGASREFIKSRISSMSPDEVDRLIDGILIKNGVPNYVYPRKGNPNAKAPTPPTAKQVFQGTAIEQLRSTGRVEPAKRDKKSGALTTVESKIKLDNPEMQARATRVAAIQEDHVGDRITRIQSVETGIPTTGLYKGLETANGVCLNGHIHIHKDFHTKTNIEAGARTSGFKVRGGDDPLETTIAHEMGHALLTNWDLNADQRKVIGNAIIEHLGLAQPTGHGQPWTYNKLEALIQQNRSKIGRRVSKYASTNANEFMAEIWADYTMNPRPAKHTKLIGDAIRSVVKGLPARR